MSTNCYKFKLDGGFWDGLEWCDRFGQKGCIMVGPHNGTVLWHDQMFTGGVTPDVEQGMLFAAAPLVHEQTLMCVLSRREMWRGAIVLVETGDLNFQKNGVNIKVPQGVSGAESISRPLLAVGTRCEREKYQLLAIQDGESFFVADHERRYLCYECINGVLIRQKADPQKLCELYVQRARRKYLRDRTELRRVWSVLKGVGYPELWSRDLEKALRVL